MRDSQRQKVYDAEREAFAESFYARKPYMTLAECEAFLKAACSKKRISKRFSRATSIANGCLELKGGADDHRATGSWRGFARIRLPLWSRTEPVMLHELAHCVQFNEEAHGWRFCETYLLLVLHVLGRKDHDALKAAFRRHRVKFSRPKASKPLSPERRAVAVAALEAYRQSKKGDTLLPLAATEGDA